MSDYMAEQLSEARGLLLEKTVKLKNLAEAVLAYVEDPQDPYAFECVTRLAEEALEESR
jgi:hypothetical protein